MKKIGICLLSVLLLCGCAAQNESNEATQQPPVVQHENETKIELSDDQILIDGESESEKVRLSNDIIYYEENQPDTYGEGSKDEEHSAQEAQKHTVVTIVEPGEYRISGKLSYGQIAVDLKEDAKSDASKSVTLILDDVQLTCTVAPALIVYNAYECAQETKKQPTAEVDLSDAGFHLVLADDSLNVLNGSHVAKIYKPGTEDKLHKYDAAIQSMVSFTISGEIQNNGQLMLYADNEGIETKMHLLIESGTVDIRSNDDSLNASEDGVSVIHIAGGVVMCDAGGGSEGDGIDSNGWLIIDGGTVISNANQQSLDSGLDSDNGIMIHGGTVLASGNMLDEISEESLQNVIILQMGQTISEETVLVINKEDTAIAAFKPQSSVLVFSSQQLSEGDYSLWQSSGVEGKWKKNLLENPSNVTYTSQLLCTEGGMNGPMGMMQRPGKMEGFDPSQFNAEDFDWSQMGPSMNFNPEEMNPEDFDMSQMGPGMNFNPEEMNPEDFDMSQMGPGMNFNPGEMNLEDFESMMKQGGFENGEAGTELFTVTKGINQFVIYLMQ